MQSRRLLAAVALVLGLMGLVTAVAPSVLAASTNLTFWHYWDGANGQAVEQLINRFEEENPEIQIEPVFVPGSELLTKLRTAVAGGQVPDMAITDLVNMPLLVRSGRLVPLDPYLASSNVDLEDFFPAALTYGAYHGNRYSLPVSASNLALYWNKRLFAEAGLDPNRPPKTWEELVAFGKQIRERTGKWGFELYTEGGEGTSWHWQIFLWSAGGDLLSQDLQQPAFNSSAGVKALQYWIDLIEEGVSPLAPWGLFGRGEAAMVIDGSWMTQFFPMQVNFELGAAIVPAPASGRPATNLGGEQIFIMANDEAKQDAAWRFIEWFVSKEVQVEWDRLTGFIPVRRSVAEDPTYQAWVANARPLLQPFVEAQTYAHARPPVPAYPELSDTLARFITEALYGRLSASQALENAEAQIRPLLR